MAYMYDPCDPCCGEGACLTTCDCDPSYVYRVTISGITGVASCLALNGTWDMTYLGGTFCTWRSWSGVAGEPNIYLSVGFGGRPTDAVTLILTNPAVPANERAEYRINCTDWDCETGGVFTRFAVNSCSGWPATLTVTRV